MYTNITKFWLSKQVFNEKLERSGLFIENKDL